jgi:SprT protein
MPQALTNRQMAALVKLRDGGSVDQGMLKALARKGYIELITGGHIIQDLNAIPAQAPAHTPRQLARTGSNIRVTGAQQACLDRVEQAYQQAEQAYGRTFQRPQIKFSNKMTSCAGTAKWRWVAGDTMSNPQIVFSAPILTLNEDEFIRDTPGHEAAHLIAIELYGRDGKGHGRPWKEVMRVIGQSADRCHSMKTPPKKRQPRYVYIATCGTQVELTPRQHNKLQRSPFISYTVRRTGGEIERQHFVRKAA